jgi:hypothetical protein
MLLRFVVRDSMPQFRYVPEGHAVEARHKMKKAMQAEGLLQ